MRLPSLLGRRPSSPRFMIRLLLKWLIRLKPSTKLSPITSGVAASRLAPQRGF